MSGKSPVPASAEQCQCLRQLAVSANRADAECARAILLSLSGERGHRWGFQREDTVRDWRSTFMREGFVGIERHPLTGCSPVKAEAALAVASELFTVPVENRTNRTLPRLSEETELRTGRVSHSPLSVVMRQKGVSPANSPATAPDERRLPNRRLIPDTGAMHRQRTGAMSASEIITGTEKPGYWTRAEKRRLGFGSERAGRQGLGLCPYERRRQGCDPGRA